MSSCKLPKIIVVCGQTASGKSACAFEIAQQYGGEIVNADSRQMYRDCVIGVAKPKFETVREGIGYIEGIAHHLFEEVSPRTRSSVAEYKLLADEVIADILSREKLPVVVGGAPYYIQAIVDNMEFQDEAIDAERDNLDTMDLSILQEKLKLINPAIYATIDIHNKRRVTRALQRAQGGFKDVVYGEKKYDCLLIGMKVERDDLMKRIENRTREMIEEGIVDEVKKLQTMYGADAHALQSIGYRQVVNYLNNEYSALEMYHEIVLRTRQYAKRQMTWLKGDTRIMWVDGFRNCRDMVRIFLQDND